MKKILIIATIIIAIPFAYWTISPLFINRGVNEGLEGITQRGAPEAAPEAVRSGTFAGLAGHSADGKATLIKSGDKYFVRLEEGFRVTNGPDLFVYFGKNDKYDSSARISVLKGNVGAQNYEVPADINPENYNEVWVWCRAFSVPFGKAVLE